MSYQLTGSILTLGRRARAISSQIAGTVVGQTASQIVAQAREPWPVDTGRSREALHDELKPGDRPSALIRAGTNYSTRIVSHGIRPWDRYVLLPVKRETKSLPRRIGEAIMVALGRSG